jgi:hypothetical protein
MAVATPAVPASTVSVVNSTGQDVSVTITGGTMTNVSVNGTTVGAGAGSYNLPQGGSISMTYTVAPTWAWTDPPNLTGQPQAGTQETTPVNELTDSPLPAHPEGGQAGLGIIISN